MSSDWWYERFLSIVTTPADSYRAPEPPRFGMCVYCGDRSGYGLACGAHLPLLALDPTYSDASGRMDETDYLPETDEGSAA